MIRGIVTDIEEERYLVDEGEKSMPEIEIEEQEVRSSSKKGKEDDGNLRNMLNE